MSNIVTRDARFAVMGLVVDGTDNPVVSTENADVSGDAPEHPRRPRKPRQPNLLRAPLAIPRAEAKRARKAARRISGGVA